jgi:hypothetical protein
VAENTDAIGKSALVSTEILGKSVAESTDAIGRSAAASTAAIGRSSAASTDAIGKSVTATTAAMEALNRSAAEATALLNRSAGTLSNTIGNSAAGAAETIDKTTAVATDLIARSATAANQSIGAATAGASDLMAKSAAAANLSISKATTGASDLLAKSAAAANDSVGKTIAVSADLITRSAAAANDSIGKTVAVSADLITRSAAAANDSIGKTTAGAADLITKSAHSTTEAIGRSASDAERTLVNMSAEVSHNIVGRADEINAAVSQRLDEMTRLLDEKSGGLLTALGGKSQEFSSEVNRITDQAVKSIEAKGFVFTQTMIDNSEEIARLINEASQSATAAVTRTLGQLQQGAEGVTEAAKTSINRTLQDLHNATKAAVEESRQTASATVADMLETHGMLRSDSTALFERLREANILLQEVLSGAHENMNSIEQTMVSRVTEFVAAMNDLSVKNGTTTAKVEEHLGTFNNVTGKVLNDLGDLAVQFTTHGRSLAEAVELLEKSNRRTEDSIAQRSASVETLVSTLDSRTDDFEQRLRRFSSLLDVSLDSATTRAREIASLVAETSNESVHTIEQQFDVVRASSEEQRKRTSSTISAVYGEAATEAHAMFNQAAERFTEIMQGMKHMASEMQQELEITRGELRRGILELPQETAESAAQMRRVIVDQIEALAELNRIVARHGRSLDAVEPMRRESEPAYAAAGNGRASARPVRMDGNALPHPATTRDITGAPTRRPDSVAINLVQGGKENGNGNGSSNGNGRNSGWLSDLLTRASRDESPPIVPPGVRETSRNEAPRGEERAQREAIDSLDTLSVDIARMIDNDASAELWERYQRGERGIFTRRLYTAQGQKAFDEIRGKYRADPEFQQTVEHYIHEFERLLDDVSRGERGHAVARNYLTSDTGKVYTMLAHAAGRFDQ